MNCRQPEHPRDTDPAGSGALYIYYRVPAAQAEALLAAFVRLTRLQQAATPATSPRLMKRPPADTAGDHGDDTWMEVWPAPIQHFGSLEHAIVRIEHWARHSGLQALLAGGRHHEYFEPADFGPIAAVAGR